MQVSGNVVDIKDAVTITGKSGKDFTKRELYLELPDDKYPQLISIEFAQDKCSILDNISIGDGVTVEINLRGRMWKDKVFNSISGWKVTPDAKPDESRMVKQGTMTKQPEQIPDDSELPF